MSFEKRVKIALIKKDMTLADLAREMDITRAYLGDLLKGNRQTPERINQIEEILKDVLEDE
nr:MAG TPA: Regulatory protein [Caudoviricetes sp.]